MLEILEFLSLSLVCGFNDLVISCFCKGSVSTYLVVFGIGAEAVFLIRLGMRFQ
jgi:hypothetical protein